jgi:hypothetical protein
MSYRLLVDYEVIEFLESLLRREQRLLRNRFVAIREDPQKLSDYTEPDDAGRRVQIHICGKYAVKFWQDHADQHIKFSICTLLIYHRADSIRNRRVEPTTGLEPATRALRKRCSTN